jgi:polyisoprenoid-binding protein YceI
MKSTYLLLICFLFSYNMQSQEQYLTKNGAITFFSSTIIEDIKAENNQVLSIIDASKSKMAISILIKSFLFKKALMQEHFNENYMDSYQYPKATFKGNLDNFSLISFNANNSYDLNGLLTIKGLEKNIQTTVDVKVENDQIFISGSFFVSAKDFNIKIPSIVRDKIANQIQINIDYELIEKK